MHACMHNFTWFSLFTAVTWATHFYLTEATRAACFRRTGHFLYNMLTLQPLFEQSLL